MTIMYHDGNRRLQDEFDSRRIAEFIYKNLGTLTNVTATLDTHFAYQIFFPSFWVDQDDQPLTPYREVTREQIERGQARPNPAVAKWLCNGNYPWLLKQVKYYCDELERAGKYTLYLWPPHCLLGSDGHALAGVVQEARLFHSYVRGIQSSGAPADVVAGQLAEMERMKPLLFNRPLQGAVMFATVFLIGVAESAVGAWLVRRRA